MTNPALNITDSISGPLTVETMDWSAVAQTLWAGYAARRNDANPLGGPDWFTVLERAFRPTLMLFVARNGDGSVCGILPAYVIRGLRGTRHLFSLRHGLAADTQAAALALIAAVAEHCQVRNIASAVVTSGATEFDVPYRQWTRDSLTLPLPADPDTLWSGFRDKVRNTIRKTERSDIEISTSMDQIDGFWRVSADAMAAQSLPVKPRRFFHAIRDAFGDRARLYTANQATRVIGGMLVVTGAPIACYAYGAFSLEGRQLGVNSALAWRVASDLIGQGFTELDLGESTAGGGTYKFKQRLGGVTQAVHYIDPLAPPAQSEGTAANTSTAGGTGIVKRVVTALPPTPRRAALIWLGKHGRLI